MAIETASKVTLKPIGNRVVAKREQQQETSKGGILLPDSAKKKQETAKVIAVGPGKTNKDGELIAMEVKVGDTILMDKYAAQEVTINDEEFLILKADDIIAIVEG
jgi:chaperonin GroES